MLNVFARASVARALAPMGSRLARAGVTPDLITIVGTVGAVGAAGTMIIWFFVMLDLLDGAVARARGSASPFGAVLDSTADRIADAAVFGSLLWWFTGPGHSRPLALACLLCLIFGALVSYVKARAEGLAMTCDVGLVERAERLIVALVGTGLDGLGVPYIQAIALWGLVVLSAVTVGQRLIVVHRQSARRNVPSADPAPGSDGSPMVTA